MFEGRSVFVVVPAYNEQELIGTVVATMPGIVDRIIVVDDASTDGTAAALDSIGFADHLLVERNLCDFRARNVPIQPVYHSPSKWRRRRSWSSWRAARSASSWSATSSSTTPRHG